MLFRDKETYRLGGQTGQRADRLDAGLKLTDGLNLA
jgi:hypothetical protein